jgi:hypothetical protein
LVDNVNGRRRRLWDAQLVVVVINRTTESNSETQPPPTKPKALSNFAVLNVCQGMASKGASEGIFFFLVPLCGKNFL